MNGKSSTDNILFTWVNWYFTEVPQAILRGWKNILAFNLNYFSLPLLLKTLFSYWRQYRWYYPRGFDIAKYAEVSFSNLISRVLGAVIRIFILFLGIAAEIIIFVAGAIVLIIWLIMPLLVVFGLWQGLRLSFK